MISLLKASNESIEKSMNGEDYPEKSVNEDNLNDNSGLKSTTIKNTSPNGRIGLNTNLDSGI